MDAHDTRMDEANRLYWDGDLSVADIADRLELSRRALYDAVTPLPTGERCTDCGGTLAWANRSARSAGTATCLSCGATREIAAPAISEHAAAQDAYVARDDARSASTARDGAGRDRRATILGGVAIAGVALGAVAAVMALRRD